MVIVRPGPYICAEWDLGGLPRLVSFKYSDKFILRPQVPIFVKVRDTKEIKRCQPSVSFNGNFSNFSFSENKNLEKWPRHLSNCHGPFP